MSPAKNRQVYHKKYGKTYRKDNPIRNMSLAMGNDEERHRRQDSLDAIAVQLGVTKTNGKPNRSKLIQMIADGELVVTIPGNCLTIVQ